MSRKDLAHPTEASPPPPMERTDSPYLTTKQLAKRWHMTPNALLVARHRKQTPEAKRFPHRKGLFWPIEAVEEWEATDFTDTDATESRPPEPKRARATPAA